MDINTCKQLFNLNNNYTINDLQKSYNKLLLTFHKTNSNDTIQYETLKNNYNLLLSNISNNFTNNITNNNSLLYKENNNNNQINKGILNSNKENCKSMLSNNEVLNFYNKDSNNDSNYLYNNNEFIYVEPINLHITINFEEAYFGCSKPIHIQRIINNYNTISKESETLYIKIPSGIDNNEIIIIEKKGNCYNHSFGDIKVLINLNSHKLFKRSGLNLILEKDISLKEALLGFQFDIVFLNDKKYKINNENILSNTSKIIKNLGFKRDNFIGNLIIQFTIIYPKDFSNDQKSKLQEIL